VDGARHTRRWALVGSAVLLVVSSVLLGLEWRHPDAFRAGGGWGVSNDQWPTNKPLYVGMSYEHRDASGTVSIHSARAIGMRDSADSIIDFLVCTIDPEGGVGAVGIVGPAEIQRECRALEPAEGATLELNADPHQQLVLAVTLTRAGGISLRGVELTYSHGWRRGTQRIGGEVEVHTRGA
jgi:hypothetical protein